MHISASPNDETLDTGGSVLTGPTAKKTAFKIIRKEMLELRRRHISSGLMKVG